MWWHWKTHQQISEPRKHSKNSSIKGTYTAPSILLEGTFCQNASIWYIYKLCYIWRYKHQECERPIGPHPTPTPKHPQSTRGGGRSMYGLCGQRSVDRLIIRKVCTRGSNHQLPKLLKALNKKKTRPQYFMPEDEWEPWSSPLEPLGMYLAQMDPNFNYFFNCQKSGPWRSRRRMVWYPEYKLEARRAEDGVFIILTDQKFSAGSTMNITLFKYFRNGQHWSLQNSMICKVPPSGCCPLPHMPSWSGHVWSKKYSTF